MKTFDATVDFDADNALETELATQLTDVCPGTPFTVVIRAEGENCEIGEIYPADEDVRSVSDEDWCVTACNVQDAADALRECLRSA